MLVELQERGAEHHGCDRLWHPNLFWSRTQSAQWLCSKASEKEGLKFETLSLESEFVVHLFLKKSELRRRNLKKLFPGVSHVYHEFFKNGMSGVGLCVLGSLVDFDFVCWCSQGPTTRYALSDTANRGLSRFGPHHHHRIRLQTTMYLRYGCGIIV